MQLRLYHGNSEASAPLDRGISHVIAAYLDNLRQRVLAGNYSADALDNAARDLNKFLDWKGDCAIDACNKGDLVAFLLETPSWKSNHVKRRVINEIVACFNWAWDEKCLIPYSPYRKPKNLKLPVAPRRDMEPNEYITLMRKGGRPLRRGLYFLHRTGARPCEMREARKTDINWTDGMIALFKHKTARATGAARIIALDPGVIRFLRNICLRSKGEFIFSNRRGTQWDRHTFARNLRRVATKAKLDVGVDKLVSAYCVRHMFCGEMVDLGFSDRQIADQMGHMDTRLVSWYSKNRNKVSSMRKVADNLRKRRRQKG